MEGNQDRATSRTESLVSLAVPPEWLVKESWTLLTPTRQANVIASAEPLDPEMTLDRYVETQGDLLSQSFPGFQEHRLERVIIAGTEDARLREFGWKPDDGGPVRQIQVYAVVDSRGITATATTTEDQVSDYRDALLEVLLSLVISHRS